MRMMGNVKAGNKDISKIASRLDYLQILSCERRSLIPSIKKTAQSIFSQQRFSVVMQVNEGTEHTTIYERHYPNGKNATNSTKPKNVPRNVRLSLTLSFSRVV